MQGIYKIGQARVDFDAHEISGPAGDFSVEPKVMDVLAVLLENTGQVVTRDDLIDAVWGVEFGGDERLSRAIYLLRKCFGESRGSKAYIKTIPRRGYKFIMDFDPVSDIDASEIQTDITETIEPDVEKTVPATDPIPAMMSAPTIKARKPGLWMALGTLLVASLALLYFARSALSPPEPEPPLVMIMDSAHPARIYDEEVKAEGATNADILSDILADLPVRTQKELISPSWHRHEAITQFEPDLVLVHYSGFKQESSKGDRPQLRLLIKFFENTDTEFLVYSRASEKWLDHNMGIVMEELYTANPDLKDRVHIYPLLEYGEPNWKDPASAQGVKLRIKELLELE